MENPRLKQISDSIFSTMSALAFEHKAVNLGQGFPDFDGPEFLAEQAYRAMKDGKNQYAPTNGIMSLRKIIAEVDKAHYGMDYSPADEITVTAGATEALFSTINALVSPGDEIITFEPFYDSYFADVAIAGGTLKCVTLRKPDFAFDPDELKKAVTPKTRMIIVNNPHNPTGKVYTRAELEAIAQVAIEHNLLVISDEVYEYLTFDGTKHIPISTIDGMRNRTVTISSTGKTFGMTGWKIGYAIAEKSITETIRKVHQWTTFAVNTPGQHAMAYAFTQLESYLPNFRKLYEGKRNLLYTSLLDSKFTPHKPHGSYFMMADVPENWTNDVDCAMDLVKKFGVATIPPSVFYTRSSEGKTMLRLCFAKSDETLRAGVSALLNV
jgi:N-succinyldiaminopimelate aminotransferase